MSAGAGAGAGGRASVADASGASSNSGANPQGRGSRMLKQRTASGSAAGVKRPFSAAAASPPSIDFELPSTTRQRRGSVQRFFADSDAQASDGVHSDEIRPSVRSRLSSSPEASLPAAAAFSSSSSSSSHHAAAAHASASHSSSSHYAAAAAAAAAPGPGSVRVRASSPSTPAAAAASAAATSAAAGSASPAAVSTSHDAQHAHEAARQERNALRRWQAASESVAASTAHDLEYALEVERQEKNALRLELQAMRLRLQDALHQSQDERVGQDRNALHVIQLQSATAAGSVAAAAPAAAVAGSVSPAAAAASLSHRDDAEHAHGVRRNPLRQSQAAAASPAPVLAAASAAPAAAEPEPAAAGSSAAAAGELAERIKLELPIGRRREDRVHPNAATPYPNMKADLMDLMEESTPSNIPMDVCGVILDHTWPDLETCLPLPAGAVRLAEPDEWYLKRGAIEMQGGDSYDEGSVQYLRFEGGGCLMMIGRLFKGMTYMRSDSDNRNQDPAWYVLRTPQPPTDSEVVPHAIDHSDPLKDLFVVQTAADINAHQGTKKFRRRVDPEDKPLDPRWLIEKQHFAYYQVLPFGINLFRSPRHGDGLISGICLMVAKRSRYDIKEVKREFAKGSTPDVTYVLKRAQKYPLTGPNHSVTVYFL